MPHVIAPSDCYLVPLGHAVTAGEIVEVSDEDAESLLEQGWKSATKAAAAKADKAAKTEEAEEAESTKGDV